MPQSSAASLDLAGGWAVRRLAEAERRAAILPPEAVNAHVRKVGCVGVVGAGTMGAGIALACLNAGFAVSLFDQSAEVLRRGADAIRTDFARRVTKGRMSSGDAAIALRRLTIAETLDELASVDLVIEAVFESLQIKREVFAQLDRICRADCVLASNTSTLDFDQIAGATGRPHEVVGLHFFSPANVMRLVEIVRGRETAPDILATAMAFVQRLNKVGVLVGNCYGFAANRMIEGFGREANLMLLEGASPQAIDAALTGFGMAMGPLAVADIVGIDVPYRARLENSQAAPGDRAYYRMADCLVAAERLGQKTGRGYYLYPDDARRGVPDPEFAALAAMEGRNLGVRQRDLLPAEIVDRCILPIVNEGARVLQEGIAQRPSDLDVIYVSGFGFPAALGGPMTYADNRGLDRVLARIREFSDLYGESYWRPAELLVDLAARGGRFSDLSGDRP